MCITLYYGKLFRVLRDKLGRQYGWKVFRVLRDGSYAGEYCGTKTTRPKGKWLKAQCYSPLGYEMQMAATIQNYTVGWHLFRKRSEAKRWGRNRTYNEVVKVLVRKARDMGYVNVHGNILQCFIADEIFIPK